MDDRDRQTEIDYEAYKRLLELWSRENPIKTTKLQVLLAVNAVLVSAVSLGGGVTASRWYVFAAGALFSAIWMFSIGRTSLFQDVWQVKLADLRRRHPNDLRFSILETEQARRRTRPLLQMFGALSSKWYLLFAPLGLALAWLIVLIVSLTL
jgi:hypothetical protein